MNKKCKLCQVCGDEATSFNCNGLTCQSCKMFFRRNFNKFERLICSNTNNCAINKFSRIYCPKCRLSKCFTIGMRQDTIGKNRDSTNNQVGLGIPKLLTKIYPEELISPELALISEVQCAMHVFVDENALRISHVASSQLEIFNLHANYAEKIIKFCKNIAAFKALSPNDQLTTLKGVFFNIIYIRLCYQFNPQEYVVRMIGNKTGDYSILIDFSKWNRKYDKTRKFKFDRKFKATLHSLMGNDPTLRDLIIAQTLFKPRKSITNIEFVNYEHMLYSRLLRRYLQQKSTDVASVEKKCYILACLLDNLDEMMNTFSKVVTPELDLQGADQILKEVLDI